MQIQVLANVLLQEHLTSHGEMCSIEAGIDVVSQILFGMIMDCDVWRNQENVNVNQAMATLAIALKRIEHMRCTKAQKQMIRNEDFVFLRDVGCGRISFAINP